MTLSIKTPLALTALFAATAVFAQPIDAPAGAPTDAGLAAASLSQGESVRAIAMLQAELEQYPGDPALLINLGIAYAQSGSDAEARNAFEAAMASREALELETADGTTMDSRRLARRAIAMLNRGEFRSVEMRTGQFSLNDQ